MSTRITRPLSGVKLYTMGYAARITGIGSAFPEKHLRNDELIRMLAHHDVETSEQWIMDRTGIRERRIANVENEAETNSSLGARAARKAIKKAGRKVEDIDQIIYATCSP
ncbi:MAG: hypothetical protein PVJ13_14495, partial [Desulfobacterales bacterium]